MTLNPCCIPLKTGVRIVTHLSMALALCVGWASLRMMSISLEVSSEIAISPSSTDATHRPQEQQGHQYRQKETFASGSEESMQPPFYYNNPNDRGHRQNIPLPPPPLPPQSPASGGVEPFRIPYEYILLYNWHQQQRQQQLRQHHNLNNQPQQPQLGRYDPNGFQFRMQTGTDTRPHPPLPPLLPLPPTSPVYIDTKTSDHDDDDDKFFRSVLQQRKYLKERPSMDLNSRNSEDPSLPTPSPHVQGIEVEVRDQIPKDLFPSFRSDESSSGGAPVLHDHHDVSGEVAQPRAQFSTTRLHDHRLEEERQQQQEQQHEMNRRMRIVMSTFPGEYSQRDGTTLTSTTQSKNAAWKKQSPDFREQYAKVLLLCGLLALCTVIFQFFTSFLLLCFVDKGSNAAAQIWTAVNCSVVFCLATCLVLFLCEGLSIPKYAFDETLYLSLVTVDSLLSIYFLWVVMAFI